MDVKTFSTGHESEMEKMATEGSLLGSMQELLKKQRNHAINL